MLPQQKRAEQMFANKLEQSLTMNFTVIMYWRSTSMPVYIRYFKQRLYTGAYHLQVNSWITSSLGNRSKLLTSAESTATGYNLQANTVEIVHIPLPPKFTKFWNSLIYSTNFYYAINYSWPWHCKIKILSHWLHVNLSFIKIKIH